MEEEEEEEEESLNTGIVAVSVCDILLSSQSANFQNPSNTARLRGLGLPLQGWDKSDQIIYNLYFWLKRPQK